MSEKKGIKILKSSEGNSQHGKSYFFGIGINKYQYFPSLNNAVKDIRDIVALLEKFYDIDESFLLFDQEATRDNIITQFDRLVQLITPQDKLIIYYSGHGHLNIRKKGFWIPTEAGKNNTTHYIRNSAVKDFIEEINSRHTLLISDSCFSGSLFVRGTARSYLAVDELEQKKSRWALCSGRHDEEVADGVPGTNSPFAVSIKEVLKDNKLPKLNIAKWD